MDLINILQRLNAISEESKKKPDADKDGVPDWADKKPGADDTANKKKANEDIMNVMRGLKALQEAEEKCSKCDCAPCECSEEDKKVSEAAGYDGSEPLDLSTNPSVNDVFKRALHIYDYEGYGNNMDYSEDDAIDQYVAGKFGQDVLDKLNAAKSQQYFGRADGKGPGGGGRTSNLGTSSAPGGNFRTTKAGKMYGQDANMMKNKVAGRLGRHPAPSLPESDMAESLNSAKLADIMGADPQQLRVAVARASAGKQTRTDVMLLSDTFVKLINMPDDTVIQKVANLIKSGNPNKPDVEEGNEFSGALDAAREAGEEEFEVGGKKYKVTECDAMGMSPLTMMGADHEGHDHADMGTAKDRYTLSISKADGTTLNATTDAPDELAALMKAVGMGSNTAAVPAKPDAVEEEFGNTPAATNERDPRLHGHTKDWGLPGTGAGKPNYPGTRASGDNPMAESMFKEYLKFKSGK